jgi:hypothetical protein
LWCDTRRAAVRRGLAGGIGSDRFRETVGAKKISGSARSFPHQHGPGGTGRAGKTGQGGSPVAINQRQLQRAVKSTGQTPGLNVVHEGFRGTRAVG